jgi:hypothetical protein
MERQTQSETARAAPIPHRPDSASVDTATLELLASWRRQDATENPETIRAAEQELIEFKRAMNESRTSTGERLLFP